MVTYTDLKEAIKNLVTSTDVTNPAEMIESVREGLADGLNQGLTVSGEAPLAFGRKVITIDSGDYPSYFATAAVEAQNGDFLAFCHVGETHGSTTDTKIVMYRSIDGGNTWGDAVTVAENALYACDVPHAVVTQTGRIVLKYRLYNPALAGLAAWISGAIIRYSDDHGYTWSVETDLYATIGRAEESNFLSLGLGVPIGWAGNLLLATNPPLAGAHDPNTINLYRAGWAGTGWGLVSTIHTDPAVTNLAAPKLGMTENGNLVCVFRVYGLAGYPAWFMGMCYSTDTGATWSDPIYYPEIIGTDFILLQMPGRLMLVVRGLAQLFSKLTLFSSKDGFFWHRTRAGGILDMLGSYGSGYVSLIPLKNGSGMLFFGLEDFMSRINLPLANTTYGLYATFLTESDLQPVGKAKCKILEEASIGDGETTALADCIEVDMEEIEALALTARATYGAGTVGIRVHVRTSPDRIHWDTDDYTFFDPTWTSADTEQKTAAVAADPRFLKVLVENLDPAVDTGAVEVWAVVTPKYA